MLALIAIVAFPAAVQMAWLAVLPVQSADDSDLVLAFEAVR
jgi:hypothetical protein